MLDHRLLVNPPGGGVVTVKGSNLLEQLTEADLVSDELTFSAPVEFIEIYNTDEVNAGTFTVNGVVIAVPADTVFGPAAIGVAPDPVVLVDGGTTSYIVSRYR